MPDSPRPFLWERGGGEGPKDSSFAFKFDFPLDGPRRIKIFTAEPSNRSPQPTAASHSRRGLKNATTEKSKTNKDQTIAEPPRQSFLFCRLK
jgi:hypothetical protein